MRGCGKEVVSVHSSLGLVGVGESDPKVPQKQPPSGMVSVLGDGLACDCLRGDDGGCQRRALGLE